MSDPRCSEDAIKLVADFWVLRIVEELDRANGSLRFSALQRVLDDVSPVTLSNRLRRLEERGLISRREGSEGKTSVSYSLSERGRTVIPVIRAISDFANQAQPV